MLLLWMLPAAAAVRVALAPARAPAVVCMVSEFERYNPHIKEMKATAGTECAAPVEYSA